MYSFVKCYSDTFCNIKNAKTRGFIGHRLHSEYDEMKDN